MSRKNGLFIHPERRSVRTEVEGCGQALTARVHAVPDRFVRLRACARRSGRIEVEECRSVSRCGLISSIHPLDAPSTSRRRRSAQDEGGLDA